MEFLKRVERRMIQLIDEQEKNVYVCILLREAAMFAYICCLVYSPLCSATVSLHFPNLCFYKCYKQTGHPAFILIVYTFLYSSNTHPHVSAVLRRYDAYYRRTITLHCNENACLCACACHCAHSVCDLTSPSSCIFSSCSQFCHNSSFPLLTPA